MRREHPIFSPVALVATGILLLLLTTALIWQGGRAFSPGGLSAVAHGRPTDSAYGSHAEFQAQCTQCHAPFQGVTAERCGACHELVLDQIDAQSGLHGQLAGTSCANCHDEHQGADYDLLAAAVADFSAADHAQIFLLDGEHEALECAACHQGNAYANIGSRCQDCHVEPPSHHGEMGLDCVRCHTTATWAEAQLRRHPFPLDHGIAAEIPCTGCHEDVFTRYSCLGCHEHREAVVLTQHEQVDLGETPLLNCASCHPAGQNEEVAR